MKKLAIIIHFSLLLLLSTSCIKKVDLYEGKEEEKPTVPNAPGLSSYIYPFKKETRNVKAEIIIKLNKQVSADKMTVEIPYLKYNKSWLCLLTQDDCKQAAYTCTWAAINGKPLTKAYFYDAAHLKAGDLPPDTYSLKKTLGCTDGAGHEVRFAFTTTISPEWEWMDAKAEVKKGFSGNYYRFFMKSGLIWENVAEMVNYGCGIAFHNVDIPDEKNITAIKEHYKISQKIILNNLSGRGCKMLAEPDGNKAYVTAAQEYAPIQVMTAQTGTVALLPFQTADDLQNKLLGRGFYTIASAKKEIANQLQRPQTERTAIHIGVHGTDDSWAQFLLFINDLYGKDGDDSVWFPSMEEYYEYNYYRIHGGTPQIEQTNDNTLKIILNLPSNDYFYYPSLTVNVKGIKRDGIVSITSNDAVTGLALADYKDGIMLNIDCRKYLTEHAAHFVEQYEKDKSNASNKADALYFTEMLKDSPQKSALLKRINLSAD